MDNIDKVKEVLEMARAFSETDFVKYPSTAKMHILGLCNLLEDALSYIVDSRKAKPGAWLFQHEETGATHIVDHQQVVWGFEKNNPRLQKICPLYSHQGSAMGGE